MELPDPVNAYDVNYSQAIVDIFGEWERQPIGGVNQKIEGFFDVCQAKGITGKQGVIIPKSNVRNLTLKNSSRSNYFPSGSKTT